MATAFDDASDRCLGNCFDVLADGLAVAADAKDAATRDRAEAEATERFKRCCDVCGRAKRIAAEVGPIAPKGV